MWQNIVKQTSDPDGVVEKAKNAIVSFLTLIEYLKTQKKDLCLQMKQESPPA